MKFYKVLFVCATFIISCSLADLEPPEASLSESLDKPKSLERKAAKGLDEDTSEESNQDSSEKTDDEDTERFIKLMSNDLNFPSGGIKIIKAPDLSKDNEGKKITEALAMMLENQEKWIQKIEEELEEINKNDGEAAIERQKTAEEIEGNFLYFSHENSN